jgi:hypothetical protein
MMASKIPGEAGITLKRYTTLFHLHRHNNTQVLFCSWEAGGSSSGIGWKQIDRPDWQTVSESFLKYISKVHPCEYSAAYL